MKQTIIAIFSILAGVLMAYSQSGVWSGDLEVQGMKIPVIFHLDSDNPTLDSPAQGVKGIPMQFTINGPDNILIDIPVIGATFKGEYKEDIISGIFTQRGLEIPLILKPEAKVVSRPQTPQPPYTYSTEEVSFTNGDAILKGTLTLPAGYDRDTPVLIMITGSGLQNRDEEIFDHKPFAVIADVLARNGIASLRYDDRGFGESKGDAVNCTTEDLMNDALSGINLLREKFNKVGVLGHSEGGTVALMLGADKNVDFIVSLAAMAISGKDLLSEQNHYALSKAGYPEQVVDDYCGLLSLAFDEDDRVMKKLETSDLPPELKQNLQAALLQLRTPYFQYFLNLDIRPVLGNIVCPVLALNGKKDTQVFYEKNLDSLTKGLPQNDFNRIVAFDNLNHLFQNCETGSVNEYAFIEETISPEILQTICQWINGLNL